MNKEQQVINQAIKKAMKKLMGFALSKNIANNGGIGLEYIGRFNDIWITTSCLKDRSDIIMIHCPRIPSEINAFMSHVEERMAKINSKIKG